MRPCSARFHSPECFKKVGLTAPILKKRNQCRGQTSRLARSRIELLLGAGLFEDPLTGGQVGGIKSRLVQFAVQYAPSERTASTMSKILIRPVSTRLNFGND
jgi:hypothetical protein